MDDDEAPDHALLRKLAAESANAPAVVTAPQPSECWLLSTTSIYHQEGVRQPTAILDHHCLARPLASDEQPYVRRASVGERWQPLEAGWLRDASLSLLVITNEEGCRSQTLPSASERAALGKRVIEVAAWPADAGPDALTAFAQVGPGEVLSFRPAAPLRRYFMRCLESKAECTLAAIPA